MAQWMSTMKSTLPVASMIKNDMFTWRMHNYIYDIQATHRDRLAKFLAQTPVTYAPNNDEHNLSMRGSNGYLYINTITVPLLVLLHRLRVY